MKTLRNFSLFNTHLDVLKGLDSGNRSRTVANILARTILDPHRVLDALNERLKAPIGKDSSEVTRISVTLPIKVAEGLDNLTNQLSLAVEHIVRLSIEAETLLQDDTRWEPHQRRNHRESAGHLQPHAEGGIDP